MRNFADIILAVRYYKSWSMDQLAKKLGVTKAYIQMLERGDRVLSFTLFEKLAKVTGIPFSFMMILAEYDTLKITHPNLLNNLLEDSEMLEILLAILLYCDHTGGQKKRIDNFRSFQRVLKETVYG